MTPSKEEAARGSARWRRFIEREPEREQEYTAEEAIKRLQRIIKEDKNK